MSQGMPITPTQLMNIKPGPELDEAVTAELANFVTVDKWRDPFLNTWSTNPSEALKLMDLIEEHVAEVGILRFGADAPNIISKLATIGPEDEATFVFTGSWMESLSKAFILYQHGHTGDFYHPRFEEAKKNAPKRIIQ